MSSEQYYENSFVSTNMSKLYLDTEIADVYFVFNENEKIERVPAHKIILAVGSDAFKLMFYGDMKEQGDVTIVDSSADAFKEFLQIFYLSRVKLTMENIFNVVNLCKKYIVKGGLTFCEQFLEDTLTEGNIHVAYHLAILFNLEEIKNFCDVKITQNTTAAFESESFLECPKSVVADILKLDELSCSETKVFEACMAWIKAANEEEPLTREMVREHLGELFYEIRFRSMTIEEFVALEPLYGNIFSADECQEIREMIGFKNYQPKLFNRERRLHLPPWDEGAIIRCGLAVPDDRWCSLQSVESVKFSIDEPLLLGKLVCAPILFENINELPTHLKIFEYSCYSGVRKLLVYAQKPILKNKIRPNLIVLQKPVLIKAYLTYEIQFKINLNQAIGRFRGPSRTTVTAELTPDNIISFSNNRRGFITGLDFNPILSQDVQIHLNNLNYPF